MYAVIDAGGSQHVVKPGDHMRLNRHQGAPGETVTFDNILMVLDEAGNYRIGTPKVEGVKVTAKELRLDRGPKLRIAKYRRRKNYRRVTGHSQPYTDLEIASIAF
jgi:large subunit ribosomal protein L21